MINKENLPTVTGNFGKLELGENGIIYYYKKDDLVTTYEVAVEVLDSICKLDNSGKARIILIQGVPTSYTFDAQQILAVATCMSKAAIVVQNAIQIQTGNVLKSIAKAHNAIFELEVFESIAEAEAWMAI